MTGRRPTLCVVAGPNGSGKTTTTIQLLNNEWAADSLYINPDNIAQETFGDWNSPEAVLKAAEEATRLRYECLKLGRDFVFETVFSAPEKLEFLRKAKDAGFFIRLFYVCTSDPTINVARITQRYLNGGHEVPISKIISRYYKSLVNANKVITYLMQPFGIHPCVLCHPSSLRMNMMLKISILRQILAPKDASPYPHVR